MHASSPAIGAALLRLAAFLGDPKQDARLLAEAGLSLDPSLLPLLMRLSGETPLGVVELAERIGRDHSTISRQLTKLHAAGLVARPQSAADGRVRAASLTAAGQAGVAALAHGRARLLDQALAAWTASDRKALATLLGRFVDSLEPYV